MILKSDEKYIYILEDDEGIREVLELLLESESYQVQTFATIEGFRKRDLLIIPDLFLFDVMLPDGSGIDLCDEIRVANIHHEVPIVIMSAHASLNDLKGKCHAESFIEKPFDINVLLEKIRVAIG